MPLDPNLPNLSVGHVTAEWAKDMPPASLMDTEAQPDMKRLRAYRLAALRHQLRQRDYAGALLYDPINIRYATATRNMSVWTLHNAVRYAWVPTEGPVVVFDFHSCEHLSEGIEVVDEVRPAISWYFFGAGNRGPERVKPWAAEIADLVRRDGGGNRRIAVDRLDPLGFTALTELGIEVFDGQEPCEMARSVKSADEVACMQVAVSVAESGMARMREELRPGITENELWSHLHQVNIAKGGEWIETRLLASGPRTNPWFQESSDRVIRAGELLGFDTDMIGPFGYCADISRTYFCGPGKPKGAQMEAYKLAFEQIHSNIERVGPGVTFRELSETGYKMPERYAPNRYSCMVHGVGFCDEYPAVAFAQDFETAGYDGVLQPGMTLCVESYMGAVDGREGVKLEEQVLVTERGCVKLSTFPYEEELLGREI